MNIGLYFGSFNPIHIGHLIIANHVLNETTINRIWFVVSPQNNKFITAEVYISVDRVRDNSKRLGVSIKSELHRVLFHAALHLCGYNDKKKKEIEIMRRKEDLLLIRYFKAK